MFELFLLQVDEPRSGFELPACLHYVFFEKNLLPSSHHGFMWESLTNPEVMIFWPKVYHYVKKLKCNPSCGLMGNHGGKTCKT